jgi:hypothetical protein
MTCSQAQLHQGQAELILLVKKKHRGAGSWYTIYHLPVVKGVSEETPLLINKPMGNLCFHVASRQSWKLNRSTLQHLHEKGICFAQTLTNYLLV